MVYAKYISIEKLSSKLSIATPIFIVEGKEITKISEKNNIGYYEFSIKNFNETNISEIGFIYTIEIISNTDESIQFELYKNENQIQLNNNKTQEILISANQKKEENYKLKVMYDITKDNKEKNIFEEVQIKIHSEQNKI